MVLWVDLLTDLKSIANFRSGKRRIRGGGGGGEGGGGGGGGGGGMENIIQDPENRWWDDRLNSLVVFAS
jgi:hypothetical protein